MIGLCGVESSALGILKVGNANDIDYSNKDTESESDDQDDLLFLWEAHASQDRHWQEEDRKVRDDVERRRREVDGDNVCAGGRCGYRRSPCGVDRCTLNDVEYSQGESTNIDNDQSRNGRPTKDLLGRGQG